MRDDVRHAQVRQHTHALEQRRRGVRQIEVPAPELGPAVRRLQRHWAVAVDRLVGVHRLAVYDGAAMPHVEHPPSRRQRRRCGATGDDLVVEETAVRTASADLRRAGWSIDAGVQPAAHSMDGSTRSGGLWPSMKVLMLTITFSPMSTRPSMRGRAHVRQQHDLALARKPASFGLTAGSCSNTSRPAPANLAGRDHADQRVLVDHLAARGVDHIGLRAQHASGGAPTADDRSPACAGS